MTIIKNKYLLILLILIFGLMMSFSLIKVVFSGGGGGDTSGNGDSSCSPSDTAPGVDANSVMGDSNSSNGDAGSSGNGGSWDITPPPPPPPPPPTVDLTSWPTFELPEQIHLRWTSTNADSCNASGDWSGNKPTQGDEYLSKPRGTYTFILTCTGPGGSASDSVTVRVIQVPQCTFTANPTTIILPASSTLSWECIYADSCSIDQGIGSVNNVSGTKQVRPTKTTTYTLTCQGPDGDGNTPLQTSVNVGFVPWIREVLPR